MNDELSPPYGSGSTVGITGASGYLGSVLGVALRATGWRTIALTRRPPAGFREWRRYELGAPLDPDVLAGLDALVHCAYDMRATAWADVHRVNVVGAQQLIAAASAAGVERMVVLSSMSAYAGTSQYYGRSKLLIEQDALAAGAWVIRPGLVYGPRAGGMMGMLTRLARLPVIPLIAPRGYQFTLHEDDLAATVRAMVEAGPPVREPVGVAHPDRVPLRRVLEVVAARDGRRPRFIPLPWRALYYPLLAAGRLPVKAPLRADSILGLVRPAPYVPNLDVLSELDVSLRPFSLWK